MFKPSKPLTDKWDAERKARGPSKVSKQKFSTAVDKYVNKESIKDRLKRWDTDHERHPKDWKKTKSGRRYIGDEPPF